MISMRHPARPARSFLGTPAVGFVSPRSRHDEGLGFVSPGGRRTTGEAGPLASSHGAPATPAVGFVPSGGERTEGSEPVVGLFGEGPSFRRLRSHPFAPNPFGGGAIIRPPPHRDRGVGGFVSPGTGIMARVASAWVRFAWIDHHPPSAARPSSSSGWASPARRTTSMGSSCGVGHAGMPARPGTLGGEGSPACRSEFLRIRAEIDPVSCRDRLASAAVVPI